MLKYRPEIDGLRALSVLVVCFYHAGVPGFSGGFIGVDVFFVISGYLITSIILKDLKEDKFSMLKFYEKRARRILPVLFLVVLFCLPFAYFWMLPEDYDLFLKSLVGVFLFSSNFVFWKSVDYFNPMAEEQPLLHTWSLGVEEQFYLFFPIILMIFFLNKKLLFAAVLFFVILSLFLSEMMSKVYPAFSFYMLPTRFWELGVGALISMGVARLAFDDLNPMLLSCARICGVLLIVLSTTFYDSSTPFPGLHAIPPVAGAALLIVFARANSDDVVSRFLSMRPVVWFGLLSYSLYLWHQPILAFAKLRFLEEPSWQFNVGLVFLSLILSILSFYFFEKPIRYSRNLSAKSVFVGASLLIVWGVSYPVYSLVSGGVEKGGRWTEEVIRLSEGDNYNNPDIEQCRGKPVGDHCHYRVENSMEFDGLSEQSESIAVWGDSHADQIMPIFLKIGRDLGVEVMEFSYPGCPPIPHVKRSDVMGVDCSQNQLVLDYLLSNSSVKTVVLHSYWQNYFDEKNAFVEDGDVSYEFLEVVQRLSASGKSILLIGQVPKYPINPRITLAKSHFFGEEVTLTLPVEKHFQSSVNTRELLLKAKNLIPNVMLFEPSNYLCQSGDCRALYDGELIYRDGNHLAPQASKAIGEPLKQALEVIVRGQ